MLNIVYRISEVGNNKIKPNYINNKNCLYNCYKIFPQNKYNWHIIADGVFDNTKDLLETLFNKDVINYVDIKNGPGYPFMLMLDYVINNKEDTDIIYFVENDYVHKKNSDIIIQEGIELGADYVSLYDHPDKYLNPDEGGNPYIDNRSEVTRVYLTKNCHWKLTNSTTGTFAATVKILKRDYNIIKKYANNRHWSDFNMFTELLNNGASLITPIPGYSTHGETAWLTPLCNWEKECLDI